MAMKTNDMLKMYSCPLCSTASNDIAYACSFSHRRFLPWLLWSVPLTQPFLPPSMRLLWACWRSLKTLVDNPCLEEVGLKSCGGYPTLGDNMTETLFWVAQCPLPVRVKFTTPRLGDVPDKKLRCLSRRVPLYNMHGAHTNGYARLLLKKLQNP